MYVIGTAGHVDHGKSTLVKALTGIDPDRLAEEKAREMTIDLGFAWLTLDDIEDEVGVVDVPGHRDFIENMLAGVGGIDLALFVVAADEGVMPQTREHLAILDLLEIGGGIIAITKTDLIDDEDWLELVTLDIAEAFEGTALENAPLIHVSAHSGNGIPELQSLISEKLLASAPKADTGRPRLPIDRVFSLSGYGTVVTGTLLGGHLRVGDEILLQPANLAGRIRGLQTHKTKLDVARPGSRVAVNLTSINKTEVKRGNVLTKPDVIRPTTLIDTQYRHLAAADAPLKHNSEVKLFVGSAEILARTRIIGSETIEPGEDGWLQLALRDPVAVVRGDRFILRRPSPGATLGGGHILDSQPGRQHRRFLPQTVERLQTLSQGTPAELLVQTLQRLGPTPTRILQQQAGLSQDDYDEAIQQLLHENQAIQLGKELVASTDYNKWLASAVQLISDHHRAHPLRVGIPREEVRSRLGVKPSIFNPFAARQDAFIEASALLHMPDHAVSFSAEQQSQIDRLLNLLSDAGINAPNVKEQQAIVGDDVYQALLDMGELVQISHDVAWRRDDYEKFTKTVYNYLVEKGTITAAEMRDLFATSRKYAIGLLEHLDNQKMTRRVGDARQLAIKPRE